MCVCCLRAVCVLYMCVMRTRAPASSRTRRNTRALLRRSRDWASVGAYDRKSVDIQQLFDEHHRSTVVDPPCRSARSASRVCVCVCPIEGERVCARKLTLTYTHVQLVWEFDNNYTHVGVLTVRVCVCLCACVVKTKSVVSDNFSRMCTISSTTSHPQRQTRKKNHKCPN